MITVTLDDGELAKVRAEGERRSEAGKFCQNMKQSLTHNDLKISIDGALAELAYAKAIGLKWHIYQYADKGPDVGNVQIRSTRWPRGRLILRKRDNPLYEYVLVIDRNPRFDIIGKILGSKGMVDRWIDNPNGGETAWFVPQEALTAAPWV